MSNEEPIVKDRPVAYFTQNNSPIRVKCPECMRITKSPRQCKIFKKLPGLWWHIKQEHEPISNLQFNTNDIIDVLNGLSRAQQWGMISDDTETTTVAYVPTATSSSLLFDGRNPRGDVLEKLANIAHLLEIQSVLYPNFNLKQLSAMVKIILGNVDPEL